MTDQPSHDPAQEAAAHMRAAALELIAAARALLDVTEQLVKDPGPIVAAVAALAAAGRPVEPREGTAGESPGDGQPAGGAEAGPRGRRSHSRVQHIRVS